MEWVMEIIFDRKVYHYQAELIQISKQLEHFRIVAQNKTLVFQSNRPLLLSKGLKHRRVDFKLIEGTINNTYFLGLIIN
jgi:hypothetical protein